jgi:CheY-like chemotaxis protein
VVRILIIDANQDSANTLAQLVELWGHTVTVLYASQDALETAHHFAPDVVLCDLVLPQMDGFELCGTLRREPALARVRFFAMTGAHTRELRARAAQVGIDRYLLKPLHTERLRGLLGAGLDVSEAAGLG